MPTAADISIRDTLELLDGPFAKMSHGVAIGSYVFWIGSGISSNRVDDLKHMIRRVLAHLQTRIDSTDVNCPFRRALEEALDLANLSNPERLGINLSNPVDTWPSLDIILQRLPNSYSRLLDIRVGAEEPDYLLWEGVQLLATFAPADLEPDCEHLCLGILAIEGVAPDIVSVNWDGLIEAAVTQLTSGRLDDVLRVCVRAEDLREPRRRAQLIKIHGCAVRAAADPAVYRPLIIARLSQITNWRHAPASRLIRDQIVNLSVTSPTFMIGLSGQDTNIQDIFADATARMEWPWPSNLPAYVFSEDALGNDHRNILRYVYRAAYDAHAPTVEASALLRAFAKPLLVALVLHVVASKLITHAELAEAPGLSTADWQALKAAILHLRDRVGDAAPTDRLVFMRSVVSFISRALRLFREGRPPSPGSREYLAIDALPLHQISADPGIQTSGLRELAVAIALLGLGDMQDAWRLMPALAPDDRDGVLTVSSSGTHTRMHFIANTEAELTLEMEGVVTDQDGDAVIVHSSAPFPRQARSPRLAPGRTGLSAPRHVDMREMLRTSTGLPELLRRFREEAVL
jgi:hypothetical protein